MLGDCTRCGDGDVVTFGGEITLSGSVTGDIVAIGGGIRVAPTAQVGGRRRRSRRLRPRWQGAAALTACYAVMIAIFGAILRRVRLENISAAFSRHALRTFLTGIVALGLVTGLLFLASQFGHCGNWVILITLIVAVILFAAGLAAIAYWLGQTILQRSTAGALATGALLLVMLQLIPLVGTFVASLLFVFAVGATVLSAFKTRWRTSIASPPPRDPAGLSSQS